MGRRPIGKQAMTAAERQRKRRLRKQTVTEPVTKPEPAPPSAELIEARLEIERLREELVRQQQMRRRPPPLPRTADERAARATEKNRLASLKRRLAETIAKHKTSAETNRSLVRDLILAHVERDDLRRCFDDPVAGFKRIWGSASDDQKHQIRNIIALPSRLGIS